MGGGFPLWNSFGHLGGTPLAEDAALGLLYPPNWIVYALSASLPVSALPKLIHLFLLAHLAVAGLSTAAFAVSFLGARWRYAALAGVLVEASGYYGAYLVGPPHTVAFALLPCAVYAWHRYLLRPRARSLVALALLQALALLGGFQFVPVYLTSIVLFALTLYHHRGRAQGRQALLRDVAALGMSGILTAILAAIQIIPGLAGYSRSYRAAQASLEWAGSSMIDPAMFVQLLLPNSYHGLAAGTAMAYWTYYIGILPLVLVFLGLAIPGATSAGIRAALWCALAGGLIAMGSRTIVGQFAYAALPGFGIFRSMHYAFVLVVLGVAVAAAGMLHRIEEDPTLAARTRRACRAALWGVPAVGIVGVLALVAVQRSLIAGGEGSDPGTTFLQGQWILLMALLFVSLLAIGGFARRPRAHALAVLAAILVIDGSAALALDPLLSSRADPVDVFTIDPVTARLSDLRDDPLERVIVDSGMPLAHSGRPFDIYAHRAYTPIPPPAGAALLDRITGSEDGADAFGYRWLVLVETAVDPGAGWTAREELPPPPDGYWLERPYPAWRRSHAAATIYENEGAFPRAFAVERTVAFRGQPHEEVAALGPLDLRTTALVDARDPLPPLDGSARVEIVSYADTQVHLRVNTSADAFIVLTDAFHPAWRLSLDGAPATLYRTNVHFRGFLVGPGEHDAIMTYTPERFYAAAAVSVAGTLLAAGLAAWDLRRRMSVT